MLKLSPSQVEEICQRYQAGESSIILGQAFSVNPGTILRAIKLQNIPARARGETLKQYSLARLGTDVMCTRCLQTFPFTTEYFACDNRRATGLRPWCRACSTDYLHEWIAANQEHIRADRRERIRQDRLERPQYHQELRRRSRSRPANRERDRIYDQTHRDQINARVRRRRMQNPEKTRAGHRAYRLRNLERLRAQDRARYWNNPEKAREQSRRWARNHPEETRLMNRLRKARLRNATIGNFSVSDWQALIRIFHGRCVYCGHRMARLTIDHIQAIARGGAHAITNIVPACRACNSRKWANPAPIPVQPVLPLKFA